MAAGTFGTLFAWITYDVFLAGASDAAQALVVLAALLVGWWACTVTARHLDQTDPAAIVWDEVVAFWLILWLVMPASWLAQAVAFVVFRIFDAAKPGPVAWADQRFKGRRSAAIGWTQGFGILFDDLVAALCTLIVVAVWRFA
jgi:phosphatidylglycerophosphatase A